MAHVLCGHHLSGYVVTTLWIPATLRVRLHIQLVHLSALSGDVFATARGKVAVPYTCEDVLVGCATCLCRWLAKGYW